MSSSDCKSLLVSHFPATLAKDWKRETKYLNFSGDEIRRFKHPVAGSVYVDEDRQEVSASDDSLQFRQATKLMAEDFYFSVSMCHGHDAPCWALVSFVHRHHFDTEGFMDSIHLEHVIKKFYPKGIECYEEQESVFVIEDEIPAAELITKFTQAGFVASEGLDNLIAGVTEPRTDLPEPLVMSEACRSLLLKTLPNAQPQYWTLLSKYLNHQKLEVSFLYHYVFGQAWVIEETEEVSQDGWWHSLQDVSKLGPQDYFAWPLAESGFCVRVYFVLKLYFERERQIEDVELDFLQGQLPASLGETNVLEGGCVEFLEHSNPEPVLATLMAHGFGFSETFRDHIQSEFPG